MCAFFQDDAQFVAVPPMYVEEDDTVQQVLVLSDWIMNKTANDKLRGTVATYLSSGMTANNLLKTCLLGLLSLTVGKISKTVNI